MSKSISKTVRYAKGNIGIFYHKNRKCFDKRERMIWCVCLIHIFHSMSSNSMSDILSDSDNITDIRVWAKRRTWWGMDNKNYTVHTVTAIDWDTIHTRLTGTNLQELASALVWSPSNFTRANWLKLKPVGGDDLVFTIPDSWFAWTAMWIL